MAKSIKPFEPNSSILKTIDAIGQLSTPQNIAIIPIQDYLGLGIESRINTPSTSENNWQWRLDEKYITKELADYILFLTRLYRRTNFKIEV